MDTLSFVPVPEKDLAPSEQRTGKLMEIPETVVLVGADGSERRDIVTFRPKTFLAPNAGMSWDRGIMELSPDGKILYGVHSRHYLIEVVDLASGTTLRKITRAYLKVRHVEKDWEPDFRKKHGSRKIEFEPDIEGLFPVEDGLWVATIDGRQGQGPARRCLRQRRPLYRQLLSRSGPVLLAVREGGVFCREKNEDETITIVKFRIVK